MISKGTKFNLKVFQIDKSYYELKDKNYNEIIEIIKANHEKYLHHKFDDLTLVKPKITNQKDKEFEFCSYCIFQFLE